MIATKIISDEYMTAGEINKLSNLDNIEVVVFGQDSSYQDAVNSLSTVSFFDQKRVVVFQNTIENFTEKETANLISLLEKPNECDIYFYEKKELPKSKLFCWLKSNSKFSSLKLDKNFDLVDYIKEKVKELGGEISPLATERLAQYVGTDLWRLSEEIKKLINYKLNNKENNSIELTDVDLLVNSESNLNIFNLIDAFATKNTKKAAELINDFIDEGVNEIYLLTMIERQFKNIALAKFETKITETELAKKAGLHPFVAKKSIAQARGFEKTDLVKIYQKLTKADLRLKSGHDPKQALMAIIN